MRFLTGLNGFLLPLVALGTFVFPPTAKAAPILGAQLVVENTDEIVVTFLGQSAAFTSDLYLDSASENRAVLFTTHTVPVGTSVSLGTFSAGTELVFRLYVRNTGLSFFTGPGSRNADQEAHAVVDDQFAPNTSHVGFEDLLGGGDKDYNDLTFSFTNVTSKSLAAVPEPTSLLLLGCGFIGLIGLRKKQPFRS
jgi:hypothetical protein